MMVRRWLVAGVLFGVLWVFVRGAAFTPASLLANFLVGLAVGLPVAYVFRRLFEEEIGIAQSFTAIPYVVLYVLVFVKEVIVANFDMVYRVFSPRMPLEPQVIFIPLRVKTTLGITTIANSISVTPGTVTLDHDPDTNALYVHAIDGRDPNTIVEPIRTWEDYALVIFDEELSPEHPPPEITVHPPDHPPEPKTMTDHLEVTESIDDPTDAESDIESGDVNDDQ
ncbi:Na+/H+ antiporter subunit E [Halorubrum sp. DTA98]|uniref:Na+/H+ antiporter subunit E n=1 Tax=Halorubrum sp. DTA98 TaxID=3402163 RepID=UPI003AB06176